MENSHPAAQLNALGLAFARMAPHNFTPIPFQDTPGKGFHDQTVGPADYRLSGKIRNTHQHTPVPQNRLLTWCHPTFPELIAPRILLPHMLTPTSHRLHCPKLSETPDGVQLG